MDYKYISDLHLYDIDSLDWRGSDLNLDMYASTLIDNWNTVTSPEDIVIVAGDIGHYCPRTVEVLKRLNGCKILVIGNHDYVWGSNLYTCGAFNGVHEYIELPTVHIQHIPEGNADKTKFYVHGHHHRYDMPGMQNALQSYVKDTYRLNCAADLNNNRPCTIQQLLMNKELMIESLKERGLILGG